MDNFVDFSHVIGATSGEHSNMLGNFYTSPFPMSL